MSSDSHSSLTSSEDDDEEIRHKQELADEIARIEQEMERKRLEEEIRKMEELIAQHKSNESIDLGDSAGATRSGHQSATDTDVSASYDDSHGYFGDEIPVEEFSEEEYYEEVDGDVSNSYFGEDEEIIVEEVSEGEEVQIHAGSDDGEEYEVEYVEEYMEEEDEADQTETGYDAGHESFHISGHDSFSPAAVLDFEPSNNSEGGGGSLFDAIKSAAKSRNERLEESGFDSSNASFQMTSRDTFAPPTEAASPSSGPSGGLFDAIKSAATARNDRLEESPNNLKYREHKPVVSKAPPKPMDAFDLSQAVSKRAKEREQRLAEGGEKKMTAIKSKTEYKDDFKSIVVEAAELGRLTRLNEHIVEATAVEKTPEEEWKSKGLMAITWRNQHMSVIHEAARAGAASKLPEKVTSNYESEEEEGYYDEGNAKIKRVSERMKELLQLNTQIGKGGNKIDELIAGRKEENAHVANQEHLREPKVVHDKSYYQSANPSNIKLPRRKTPKVDPQKNLEKIQEKFKGTYRYEKPLVNISDEVAERAWARRTRLDRPGAMPRVQEICNCPYCLDPTPFQTFAYKKHDEIRKSEGYHSPDSEEERQIAREKRREERRKNGRTRERGARSASNLSSSEDFTHRMNSSGISSESSAPSRTMPARQEPSVSSASNEGADVPRRPRPRPGNAGNPPTKAGSNGRTGGRIGAAARNMEMLYKPKTNPQGSSEAPKPALPPKAPSLRAKRTPVSGEDRRAMRRRQRQGGKPPPATGQGKGAPSTSAVPGTKKIVRRPRRKVEPSSAKPNNKSVAPEPEVENARPELGTETRTKIITKADGTRVIQRTVSKAPTKVVTRKVIVTGPDGKKQVKTISSSSPSVGSSPSKVTSKSTVTQEGGRRVVTTTTTKTGTSPAKAQAQPKPAPKKRGGFWRKKQPAATASGADLSEI